MTPRSISVVSIRGGVVFFLLAAVLVLSVVVPFRFLWGKSRSPGVSSKVVVGSPVPGINLSSMSGSPVCLDPIRR